MAKNELDPFLIDIESLATSISLISATLGYLQQGSPISATHSLKIAIKRLDAFYAELARAVDSDAPVIVHRG